MRLLRVNAEQVVRQPDPNRAVDFRVEVGQAYNTCIYGNAEATMDGSPAIEYLPENIREAACWMRFSAEVNVRSGPGTGYAVLDSATPNDVFPVTGQNEERTWWRVEAEGQAGWVSAEITTISVAGQCGDAAVISADVRP